MLRFTFIFILLGSAHCLLVTAQTNPNQGDRFSFTTISGNLTDEDSYGSGYSIYASVWPFFEKYPKTEQFQTGLVSAWMRPQNRNEADIYNTIEGGLGWWTGLRFGHTAPKFIMGGVSNYFYSWANGPGAGRADEVEGFRDWSRENGMLEIAQLANTVLWPPDGLNMAKESRGEFLGYGYLPIPLIENFDDQNGNLVETGNQCWTLFLNSSNFKGPITFFLPSFWTKPVLEDATLKGLFLDVQPSFPVSSYGIETATLPVVHASDQDGNTFAKVLPTQYPTNDLGESILLHLPLVYSKEALWNKMDMWFKGGPIASPLFETAGQKEIVFDPEDHEGSAFMDSRIKLNPGTETEDDEFEIESSYLQPFVKDENTWGLKVDKEFTTSKDGLLVTPEYFRLDNESNIGVPIKESDLPESTGLSDYFFESNDFEPLPFLTPLEKDCPYYDAEGDWLSPGPVAGPYTVDLQDGSTITYYWYKFNEQPAIVAAKYSEEVLQNLQDRVELIHSHWRNSEDFLPPPRMGELANLDPGLLISPPEGLEIGYIPIVTRQEKSETSSVVAQKEDATPYFFPNPSAGKIFFKESFQSVDIFSLDGKLVVHEENVSEMEVGRLEKGMYVLKISKNKSVSFVEKLILR